MWHDTECPQLRVPDTDSGNPALGRPIKDCSLGSRIGVDINIKVFLTILALAVASAAAFDEKVFVKDLPKPMKIEGRITNGSPPKRARPPTPSVSASAEAPAGFQRVTYHLDWIRDHTGIS